MCVLTEFFLDTDVHSGQFGLQEREDACNFSLIENILSKHITSNKIESMKWLIVYLHANGAITKEDADSNLEKLDKEDLSKHGVDLILAHLREKHLVLSHLYSSEDIYLTAIRPASS